VVDGEAPFAGAVVEGEEDRPGQWNLFQYTSHVTASKVVLGVWKARLDCSIFSRDACVAPMWR